MNSVKSIFYFSLAIVWIGHFLVDMMIGIWPVYKTMAHLDIAIAGVISGVCAFFGEGMQLFFGALSDRGYRKYLILGGVVVATASTFFVYTENYLCFFLLYLMTCIGSGAFHPCAASLVGDLPSPRKGLLQAVFASGGSLGLALSQVIFVGVHSHFDGRTEWLVLPAVVLMLVTIFTAFGRQKSNISKTAPHFSFKGISDLFRKREICMVYFTVVCGASMLWAVIFLLPDILSHRGYESWIAFGGGHMAFILGGAVMLVPAGYFADKYSCKKVIVTALVSGMVLLYTFLLFPILSNYSVLMLLFAVGAAVAIINPIGIALGTRLFPQRKGMVSAILMGVAWCLSEGIGQTIGGLLTKCFTDDAAAKALAVLGCLFMVGIITASQLPQKEEALEPILEPVEYV